MKNLRKNRGRGILMVAAGAGLWGGSGVAGQYLLQEAGFATSWLVVTRMLLAGVILLGWSAKVNGEDIFAPWQHKKAAQDLLIFAVFGMLSVQYTYFSAINYGNAATATVLQYLEPVVIILWLSLANWQFPRLREIICVLLAMSGTFLLVTHGSTDSLVISPKALAFGVATGIASAFYTLKPQNLIRTWPTALVTGWSMLIGGLVLAIFSPPWAFRGEWSMFNGLVYAYVIIFGTVIAFACYLGSLKYISPTETGILSSIEPMSSVILSWLFLSLNFIWLDYLAMGLILSTVFILAKR